MLRNLDTALIRAFVTVAGAGNMTLAADRLGLTQGAVSQQIKRLEETLQCVLFDRRRNLELTKDGKHLLGLSKRFLELNDEIWDEMTAPALRGEVRLGLPHDLVTTYLPLALDGFVAANPNIEVTLISATSPNLRDDLKDGKLDVAIVEESLQETAGECLRVDRLLWVGARHGTAHAKRPLPLSIVSDSCAFRSPIVSALDRAEIVWKSVFENGTNEATLTSVKADLAVSVSLASVIPADLEVLGRESGLPELPSFAINLYLRPRETGPAVLEFAHHLRDAVRGHNRLSA